MAGYSRLMGRTRRAPRTAPGHLRALIEPKIAECRDRVVKNSGDGSMAEFASVVDAVPSAVEMQRGRGSATRCRSLYEKFSVIAGVKRIEAQIRSCVGVLVAFLDRREAASISSTAAPRVPTLFVRRRRSHSTPTRVKATLPTSWSSRSIFSSSFRSRVSTRARISSRNYRRWCVLRFSACANMLSSIGVINNKYSLLLLISGKGTSTGLYAFHKLKRPVARNTRPAV